MESDIALWRLMGFISFVPIAYWTAWLLPLIIDVSVSTEEKEKPRNNRHILLAIFYSLPIVFSGGQLVNTTSLFSLLVCATHLQVVRIKEERNITSQQNSFSFLDSLRKNLFAPKGEGNEDVDRSATKMIESADIEDDFSQQELDRFDEELSRRKNDQRRL